MYHEVTVPENLSQWRRPVARSLPRETWHFEKIRLRVAHEAGYLGSGVRVAVIDSGVDDTHHHFGGSVETGANFQPDETHRDLNGHGTHVAGLVHSVAPAATIVNVKALNAQNYGTWAGVAAAIRWAATEGACDVINLSLGGPMIFDYVTEALDIAVSAGAVLVAAAGNNGGDGPFWPAYDTRVWAAGACDETGQLWPLTNRGDIDLIAPGVHVYSSLPDNRYGFLSGTSMASPLVAGVMALALQRHASGAAAAVGGAGDEARLVDAGRAVGAKTQVFIPLML